MKYLVFAVLFVLSSFLTVTAQSIIYVNAAAIGTNNGLSWANAYVSLQDALSYAHTNASVEEIWVAQGTYKPSAYPQGCSGCISSRNYTFHVRDGLSLYGGFVGNETSVSQRTISFAPTVLSGDFLGDDVVTGSGSTLTFSGNTENAYHVLLASANSVNGIGVTIDGFQITGGSDSMDGSDITVNGNILENDKGGGIVAAYGNNVISNNRFFKNTSDNGGGCYFYFANITFNDNVLEQNLASGEGGAVYHYYCNSNTTNNNFSYNSASVGGKGGAIYTYYGIHGFTSNELYYNFAYRGGGFFSNNNTINIEDNVIQYNTSGSDGGGIYTEFSNVILKDNQISQNTSAKGGGVFLGFCFTATISNNTIQGNTSTYDGGGAYINFGDNNLIQSNRFNSNSCTDGDGGGIYQRNGTNTYLQNEFENNSSRFGGGMYFDGGTNNIIQNNIHHNTSNFRGGGLFTEFGTNQIINNLIFSCTANLEGGGLYVKYGISSIITNNTIYNNAAILDGGGLATESGENNIRNNIFWLNKKNGNATVQGADYDNYDLWWATNHFENNIFQLPDNVTNYPTSGGVLGPTTYANNLYTQDPLFINPLDPNGLDNLLRTSDDGFSFQATSPCINAGTPTSAPATDITDYIRTGIPDIGAYEYNACAGTILLVKNNAIGNNNGLTWSDAYTSLQSALSKANTCPNIEEIWVAAGTYKPSAYPIGCVFCSSPRDYTFHIRDSLKIFGGFAGTEMGIAERNLTLNQTILSGDYNDDDLITGEGADLIISGNAENVHHVVFSLNASPNDKGVTIDGFHITGGNANIDVNIVVNGNNLNRSNGGACLLYNGKNHLKNNTIYGNYAIAGGGLLQNNGSLSLESNKIYNNEAGQQTPMISGSGGGMSIFQTIVKMSNNVFYNNKCHLFGGAYYSNNNIDTIYNTVFFNNHSDFGGAIDFNNSNANTVNNTFYENSALSFGGAIRSTSGSIKIKNNIFWMNKRANNVLNPGADIGNSSLLPSANTIENNMLQLGNNLTNYPINGGTSYAGNLYAVDPALVNPSDPNGTDNIFNTADDGLSIQPCSPAINAGSSANAPLKDITNLNRIGVPDIGAYEQNNSLPSIIYVNAYATGLNDGSTWANAFTSLQSALLKAHTCTEYDQIWVAQGIYKPSDYPYGCIDCNSSRDFTFHLRDGLYMFGGFAGNELYASDRKPEIYPTILSGDFIGDDAITGSGAGLSITGNAENAHHVVMSSVPNGGVGVFMAGFTITGGNANGLGSITVNGVITYRENYGGIRLTAGNNVLQDLIVYGNNAHAGGGIYISNGNLNLFNGKIYQNTAGEPISSTGSGGGIFANYANITINACHIYNNKSIHSGGGIYSYDSYSFIHNSVVRNNFSNYGAGMHLLQGTGNILNNTIYNNIANIGGGIYTNSGSFYIENNILWENLIGISNNIPGADYVNSGSYNSVNNNMLQLANNTTNYPLSGGTTYTDNIYGINPAFINPSDPDGIDNVLSTSDDGLSIQASSPAIDAGTSFNPWDITGILRGIPDLGAYEYNACAGKILLVDEDAVGDNNGLSWAGAYTSFQSALTKAHTCPEVKEIWVAEGTYKPTAHPSACGGCSGARDYTFHLRNGLKVYGGFEGTETYLYQRQSQFHATYLDGDINTVGDPSDNTYHVVLASSAPTGGVTVDGFHIINGNANSASTITVAGNIVTRNLGGGILCDNGTNTITNNHIHHNTCTNVGAGIFTENGMNTISKNKIYVNSATTGKGGGMFLNLGVNTFSNNYIYSNDALSGAGICMENGMNKGLNNVIYGNTAFTGGGIYTKNCVNTFTNNTLYGNTATNIGGGGGIFTWLGTDTLVNNIFWTNLKGGLSSSAGADYQNESTGPATNVFLNNILQLASANYSMGNNNELNPASSYNLFQTDPFFFDWSDLDGADNVLGSQDDGLHISICSPAINAGRIQGAPTHDITNFYRISKPDLGAYENYEVTTEYGRRYVKFDALGDNDGTSWVNAYASLQSALAEAHSCPGISEIWIAAGTYKPSAYPYGCIGCSSAKDYTFHLRDGLKIYGGFDGTESELFERNVATNHSILSGDLGTPMDDSDNCYHVVMSSADMNTGIGVTIDGVKITRGNAVSPSSITVGGNIIFRDFGGGILTYYGKNYIYENTIYDNSSQYSGGGIYTLGGSSIFAYNTIQNNDAVYGGGIYFYEGNHTLFYNDVNFNNASDSGGGIVTLYGNHNLTDNSLLNNTALLGAGIYILGGNISCSGLNEIKN